MGNGDTPTGKIRTMADKATNPYVILTTIATMLGTFITGGTWAIGKLEASEAKSDSALLIATKVQAGVDMFIKLQEESNKLKREEMEYQGIQVKTRSVSTSSSSSESSSSIESAVREVNIRTASGMVVREVPRDSFMSEPYRIGDTLFVPVADTMGHKPR